MIAVQTAPFVKYPLETMVKKLKQLGIKQVELHSSNSTHWTPKFAQVVRKYIEENKISISGFVWQPTGIKPWWEPIGFSPFSGDSIEDSIRCLEDNIEIAHNLGADFMTIYETTNKTSTTDKEAWKNLVNIFSEASRIAGESGITLVNEFHPGMFASTPDRAIKLVDDVNSVYFKACLDLCHAYVMTEGNVPKFIRQLGGRIGHVHLASTDGVPHMHMPLGTGLVNIKNCLNTLSDIGYEGPWSLCMYGYPCPEQAVSKSINFLKEQEVKFL